MTIEYNSIFCKAVRPSEVILNCSPLKKELEKQIIDYTVELPDGRWHQPHLLSSLPDVIWTISVFITRVSIFTVMTTFLQGFSCSFDSVLLNWWNDLSALKHIILLFTSVDFLPVSTHSCFCGCPTNDWLCGTHSRMLQLPSFICHLRSRYIKQATLQILQFNTCTCHFLVLWLWITYIENKSLHFWVSSLFQKCLICVITADTALPLRDRKQEILNKWEGQK